jgi:hypothetical protein
MLPTRPLISSLKSAAEPYGKPHEFGARDRHPGDEAEMDSGLARIRAVAGAGWGCPYQFIIRLLWTPLLQRDCQAAKV